MKLVYDQDGITEQEIMDALPSPMTLPPSGVTPEFHLAKLTEVIKVALIIKKAKAAKSNLKPCPLCEVALIEKLDNYVHPSGNCYLARVKIPSDIPHHVWDNRPIKDALRKELDDNTLGFSSEIIALNAKIARLEGVIQGMQEGLKI